MHGDNINSGVTLEFNRGLIWKPRGNHPITLDPDDKFHLSFFVYNHKGVEQNLQVRINVMGASDRKSFLSLASETLTVKPFNHSFEPSLLPDIRVKGVLKENQPYIVSIELLSLEGKVVDRIVLPEIFYSSAGTLVQLQEAQHKLYLHIYDSQGKHVGVNFDTNMTEIGIPGAYYYDNLNGSILAYIPSAVNNFRIVVDAKYAVEEAEAYNLTIFKMSDGLVEDQTTTQSWIRKGSVQQFNIKIPQGGKIIMEQIMERQTPWYQSCWCLILAVAVIIAGILLKKRMLRKHKNTA